MSGFWATRMDDLVPESIGPALWELILQHQSGGSSGTRCETIPRVLDESIRRAIEMGGRVNSFDLLLIAAQVLNGDLPPSPCLSTWFRTAVDAIGNGSTADEAFGIKRKQGPDPLKARTKNLDRDIRIRDLVDEARKQGYPTSANEKGMSCFDLVAEQLKLDEKTVSKIYYDLEIIPLATRPEPD